MAHKNSTYLNFNPDAYASWVFRSPIYAKTISDFYKEIIDYLRSLSKCFGEFITPREFECLITSSKNDVDLSNAAGSFDNKLRITFHSYPVTNNQILSAIDGLDTSTYKIKIIKLMKYTNIHLLLNINNETHKVGLGSEKYKADKNDVTVSESPLTIEINSNFHRDKPIKYIGVGTYTDMWFDDTSMAEKNRELLAEFFEKIKEQIPVTEVLYRSEKFNDPLNI